MSPPNAPNLSIQVLPVVVAESYQVVQLEGELDKAGLSHIKDQLMDLLGKFSQKYLIFDFEKLDFINSESIGFLMTIHSHLTKMDKNLVIINAKANVKDVFTVIGLFNVISYYDSLSSFLEKIKA
jgi:stage II sporulation protein AA (anti-sigma F factor antagonist)